MEVELKVRKHELHPAQLKVISEAKRLNVLACGRRWGKTVLGMELAIQAMLAGQPVAWGAPHYKYLAEPFRNIRQILGSVVKRASQSNWRLELATGGTLDCWTLNDPNAGRGRKYGLWILDEAAFVPNLQRVFIEAVRPTLMDLAGNAWLLSTPRGRGFFWECFRRGQDIAESDWMSWQMPTSANPHINENEIEFSRRTMSESSFAQEFLAEFGRDDDSVFRGVEKCVGSSPGCKAEPKRSYVAGVDLARISDYSVVTVFDDLGHQVFFDRFRRVAWETQIARVASVCKDFRCSAVVDATGVGDAIVDRMIAAGIDVLPFRFTGASKERLIDNLVILIEAEEIWLLDEQVQTDELLAFRAIRRPGGGISYSAPTGGHDDCVMAVALACSRLGIKGFEIFVGNDPHS
ncbi:MAG: hypothetical protein KF824_13520 [Fimbriimonadaceae bacterium]|nr:MAG: hypothetical protein KF824_13520 [Fimbriimonadaceae bacterium]